MKPHARGVSADDEESALCQQSDRARPVQAKILSLPRTATRPERDRIRVLTQRPLPRAECSPPSTSQVLRHVRLMTERTNEWHDSSEGFAPRFYRSEERRVGKEGGS